MSKTKKAKCSTCCPDGGAILEATVTTDRKPVWECRNCGTQTGRIIRKPKGDLDKPTAAQLATLAELTADFEMCRAEKIRMFGRNVHAWITNARDDILRADVMVLVGERGAILRGERMELGGRTKLA